MSTSFHPETDGQTERLNAIMEQYLRSYVSYQQGDWSKWLPMAEFSANNQESASTKVSPFFANYGYHPRFDIMSFPVQTTPQSIDAASFSQTMRELYDYLRVQIRTAQDVQETATNKHRTPAPAYQVKDQVFVSMKNIRTTRNARKLYWKWMGPYSVKKIVSPFAYEIDLPSSVKYHPVFHVSLLKPAANDPLPGQVIPPPPPVIFNEQEEYFIEKILEQRTHRGQLQYLVKWTRYAHPTWEPAKDLQDTSALETFLTCTTTAAPSIRRSSCLRGGATFTDE